MQKTVIDEIIQTEKEAEQTILAARKRAAEIISKADIDYNQSITQAKEEVRVKIQEAVAAAQERALSNFNKALKDSEEENSLFLENSFDQIEAVAEKIAKKIIRPEYER